MDLEKNYVSRLRSIVLSYLVLIVTLLAVAPKIYAWDFSFKGNFLHKTTDNVNASNSTLVSDTINTISAYGQLKDENDRFRLRLKANRYGKTKANNNNSYDVNYQRKFSSDLGDNFQIKLFKEKYITAPTIAGDTSTDNRGAEVQVYLANELENNLMFNGTYSFNYKDYTNDPFRKDYRLETVFGVEKIIKNAITIAPDISASFNKSKDTYYSTLSYGTNLYIGFELDVNFEMYINASIGKTNYQDRTFSLATNKKTISTKEIVKNTLMETGFNFYITKLITLEGKYTISDSNSNNTANSYKSNEWALGTSIKY